MPLDFEERVRSILRPRDQDATEPDITPFSVEYTERLSAASREIVRVVKQTEKYIPGSYTIQPVKDPQDPSFYVTALRVPGGRDTGFRNPVRLYFVLFPTVTPVFSLRIARVVAVGAMTQMMSVPSFLRAWNAAGTGGVIVYEGDGDAVDVRHATEQAALRFLQRRNEIDQWHDQADTRRTLVWPVDPTFRPVLCGQCLLPIDAGPVCPKCGLLVPERRKSSTPPSSAEAQTETDPGEANPSVEA